MKAKTLLPILMILSLTACSSFIEKKSTRKIAQIDGQKSIVVHETLEGLHPCESEYESFNQSATYIYYDNDNFFVLLDNVLTVSTLRTCQAQTIELNSYDQILRMLTHEDSGLWFHTLHGHVIRFDGLELRKIEFDFPVSSFEFEGENIKLYHSDKQGRYCDFDTLSLPLGQRPSTCSYIEAELLWREL